MGLELKEMDWRHLKLFIVGMGRGGGLAMCWETRLWVGHSVPEATPFVTDLSLLQ